MKSRSRRTIALAVAAALVLSQGVFIGLVASTVGAPAASAAVVDGPNGSRTYTSSNYACGDGTYTVPAWVTEVDVVAIGAAGQDGQDNLRNGVSGDIVEGGAGGLGTKATGRVPVTPGQVLTVGVASSGVFAGAKGGPAGTLDLFFGEGIATGDGGRGGNASWVSANGGCSQSNPLIVAAGGGGGGGAGAYFGGNSWGGAGGTNGGDGSPAGDNSSHQGGPGRGGFNGSGGNGGSGYIQTGFPQFYRPCTPGHNGGHGSYATAGSGGWGAIDSQIKEGCGATAGYGYAPPRSAGGGGGGGGGYYGGGGGGGGDDLPSGAGGGGSGDSYGFETSVPTNDLPSVTITPVPVAPDIYSGEYAKTLVGTSLYSQIQIEASGYPTPSLSADGLPPGLTLWDRGDGTGQIEGRPDADDAGIHDVTIRAHNSAGDFDQHFTLDIEFDQVDSVRMSPDPTTTHLVAGRTPTPIELVLDYENGWRRYVDDDDITWTSSDPAILTVTDGKLKPLSAGWGEVIATVDGNSYDFSYLVGNGPPQAVLLTVDQAEIGVGDVTQVHARVRYESGATEDITESNEVEWTSSNEDVAQPLGSGYFSGVGTDDPFAPWAEVSIRARYRPAGDPDGIGGTPATLRVSKLNAESITVTPAGETLAPGTYTQFTATAHYANGPDQDVTRQVTWSSSRPVAYAGDTGLIQTPIAGPGGETDITATLPNGVSGSVGVMVERGTPSSIAVTPAGSTIGLGQTTQMTAIARYFDGADDVYVDVTDLVSWTSDDSSVVEVSPEGLAIGTGQTHNAQTYINATIEGAGGSTSTGSTSVVLSLTDPDSIDVTPVNPTAAPNTAIQFTAVGHFPGGETRDLTQIVSWSSANPAIGSVGTHSGLFNVFGGPSGVGGGSTTVTATAPGGASASTLLSRELGAPVSLLVTPNDPNVDLGVSTPFHATATYSDGSTVDVTNASGWSSQAPATASVTSDGVVTGKSTTNQGTWITASYTSPYGGTVTDSSYTTVRHTNPTSITVTPVNPVILPNHGQTLTATGHFPGGYDVWMGDLVTWTVTPSGPNLGTLNTYNFITPINTPGGTVDVTVTAANGVTGSTVLEVRPALKITGPGTSSSPYPTVSTPVNAPFTSATFTATGGSGSYEWSIWSGSLPPGLSFSSTTGSSVTITGTPTTVASTFLQVMVRDTGDPSPSATSSTFLSINVTKLNQSITSFTGPASGNYGTSYPLSAAGGASGTPVTYSTVGAGSPCSISGTRVYIDRGGETCTLQANQAGNSIYNAAPPVQISFPTYWTQVLYWNSNPGVGAFVGQQSSYSYPTSDGLSGRPPVQQAIDPSTAAYCSLASPNYGAQFTFIHAGPCTVNVTQAGNATHAPAVPLTTTFTIGKAAQTLTLTSATPSAAKVGGTYTPTGSGTQASNPLAVSIAAATTNNACSTNGTTVSFDHVGTCSINVVRPEIADYNASPVRTQTFNIAKGTAPITFTTSAPVKPTVLNFEGYTPEATSPAGDVTFSVGAATAPSDTCDVWMGQFGWSYAGTCVVQASVAGNDDWNPGTATQTFTIVKAAQETVFATEPADILPGLGAQVTFEPTYGTPYELSVDPSTTNDACSVVGDWVDYNHPGTCVIRVVRPGDRDFLAAPIVTQTTHVRDLHLAMVAPTETAVSTTATAPVDVYLIDETNNVFAPQQDVWISLSSTSPGAVFADSEGGDPTTGFVIPAGSFWGTAYYGDRVAGTSTITAASTSAASGAVDISVVQAEPTRLGFVSTTSDVFLDQTLASDVEVQVQDEFGNPVAVEGVEVTLSLDAGTLPADVATTATTDATGRARFSGVRMGQTGVIAFVASASGYDQATSSSFRVIGAPVISGLSDSSGPAAGGNDIYVYGDDFIEVSDVQLSGFSAPYFAVLDEHTIVVQAPSGVGDAAITVTNPVGASAGVTYHFDATPPPLTTTPTLVLPSQPVKPLAVKEIKVKVPPSRGLVPTGTVELLDGGNVIGAAALSSTGTAKFLVSFSPGDHALQAHYLGDGSYAEATSDPSMLSVAQLQPKVSLIAPKADLVEGKPQRISGRVAFPQAPKPTGTVELLDGDTVVGTAAIKPNGDVIITNAHLAAGDHLLSLRYSGDVNFVATTTAQILVTVRSAI